MGSLTSRPKAPAQPQIVYYTPAPAASAPAPVSNPPPASSGDPAQTPEQAAAQERQKSLLQRSRGIFGTVRTSFRGLLDLAADNQNRKTLLGE